MHLSSGRVTALARDRTGHVWIGTDGGGINVWDVKTRRLYYYKRDAKQLDSLSADTIFSILVDDTGGVWIGTRGGGLDRVVNPAEAPMHLRFTNISEAQGLPNNSVYGLRADGMGNIWVSTNFGLARIDPRTLERPTRSFSVFTGCTACRPKNSISARIIATAAASCSSAAPPDSTPSIPRLSNSTSARRASCSRSSSSSTSRACPAFPRSASATYRWVTRKISSR